MSSGSLIVGMVQMAMDESADSNLAKAVAGIREAAARGARLICLPELFKSRYFCQTEDAAHFALAEEIPGPTTARLSELARELDVTLVVSLFERRAAGLYHNTAAVLDGGAGYLGKYRKMHIPDDPRYYEKYYFAPGDLGFKSFATNVGRIGVLICWDQWYPEAARLTALSGADVLLYPTAIGWHRSEKEAVGEKQLSAWQTIQRSHAVANGCFVVCVNRTGFEIGADGADGIEFWGRSFIAGPDGDIVASADSKEAVIVAEVDLASVDKTRVNWPFFRDRRIDAYGKLTERFIDAPSNG